MSSASDAILKEMALYFNADDLPSFAALRPSLPERAQAAAKRLRQAIGDASVPELIERIDALASSPEDPLYGSIMDRTMIYWPDEPESWEIFVEYAHMIRDALRAPA